MPTSLAKKSQNGCQMTPSSSGHLETYQSNTRFIHHPLEPKFTLGSTVRMLTNLKELGSRRLRTE